MKKFVTLGFAFIAFISVAHGQTHWQVDTQTLVRDGQREPLAGVFTTHDIRSGIVAWSYLGVSPGWGEILGGPALSFASDDSYSEIGIGAGVEQPDFTLRYGAYGFYSRGTLSAFLFLEYGKGTGSWYIFSTDIPITGGLSVGLFGQRYVGVGPMAKYTAGPAYISVAPVYDHEVERWGTSVGAGVRF